jgi:hypothetical protein
VTAPPPGRLGRHALPCRRSAVSCAQAPATTALARDTDEALAVLLGLATGRRAGLTTTERTANETASAKIRRVLPKHIARSPSRCRRGRCARGWPCLAPRTGAVTLPPGAPWGVRAETAAGWASAGGAGTACRRTRADGAGDDVDQVHDLADGRHLCVGHGALGEEPQVKRLHGRRGTFRGLQRIVIEGYRSVPYSTTNWHLISLC